MRIFRLVLISLIMFCLSGCKSGFFSLKKSGQGLRIAPQIKTGELSSGIKYYYMQSTKPATRCYVRLHVGIGSFVEKESELGMAHLLEHMAFDDREVSKSESLAAWFQKHGMSFGPDVNAFTAPDRTVYKIDLPTCKPEAIKDALAIFRSFADGLKFSDEALIKELAIIGAEELTQKNAQANLSQKIINHLYSGTLYTSRPVLGKAEKRALFTKEMLGKFYRQNYHPKNMALVLVGDFGEIDPQVLIQDAFANLSPKTSKSPQASEIGAGELDYKTPVFMLHEKDLTQEEVIFSIQPKKITKPRFALSLLKSRLAFDLAIAMLKSSFDKQSREHPSMIRTNSIEGFMLDDGVYELSLSTAASPNNFEKNFIDAYAYLRQASEIGFDPKEFKAMRNIYLDYIDQAVVQEATWGSDNWTDLILDHINNRRFAYSSHDYQKWVRPLLGQIDAKDCQQALSKALKSGYKFIFALGPLPENPENLGKLRTLLKKAQTQGVSQAAASKDVKFAYKIPTCQILPVAPRVFLKNIGAYRIAVSKNLHVLVKPTEFKHDEILLAVFSNNGFLSMSAPDLARARLAQSALVEGGLTKHGPEEIITLLKDKFFTLQLGILNDRTQATISTRSQDLRFALELLRASILEPGYSEPALMGIREKIKVNDEELKHNMWAPLQHEFPRDLSGQDYRVGRENLETLLSLSREDLLSWHKKYLSPDSLNIVIVGDVDIDEVMNDISCVLAPIIKSKNIKKSHAQKAKKIGFKSGIHREYHVDTNDEASKVVIRYPLMFPTKNYPDHRLPLLQNIIQESLRLKLREKKNLTYSPSALIAADKNPLTQNWLDIVISAPKDEAQKVLKETKKMLDSLAKKGIRPDQLLKAKEPYLAQISNAFNENDFWLSHLTQNFDQAEKLPTLERMLKEIKTVGPEAINQLLRAYLTSNKASSAIVHGN